MLGGVRSGVGSAAGPSKVSPKSAERYDSRQVQTTSLGWSDTPVVLSPTVDLDLDLSPTVDLPLCPQEPLEVGDLRF